MLIISLLVSMSLMGACKSEEALDPQVPLTGKVKQMQFFEGTKLVKNESFGYNKNAQLSVLVRVLDGSSVSYNVTLDSAGRATLLTNQVGKDSIRYNYNKQRQLI